METSSLHRERIAYFKEAYGEAHYIFACHAAVPLIFSTDLLYKLWLNFNSYSITGKTEKISHIAVSDLILSGLCHPVGHDLFKMEPSGRLQLQNDLVNHLGEERRKLVAGFLRQFAIRHYHPTERNLQEIHLLTANSILDPAAMTQSISEQLAQKMRVGDKAVVNLLSLYFNLAGTKTAVNEQQQYINLVAEDNPDADGYFNINLPADLLLQIQQPSVSLQHETDDVNFVGKVNEAALNAANQCYYSKTTVLDLRNLHLTDEDFFEGGLLDHMIGRCTHLKTLILSNVWYRKYNNRIPPSQALLTQPNYLTRIPACISKLINLLDLLCSGEVDAPWGITDISGIPDLANLVNLNLSYNKVVALDGIERLNKLQDLSINDNAIIDLGKLQYLENLKSIDVRNNQIVSLIPLINLLKIKKGIRFIGAANPTVFNGEIIMTYGNPLTDPPPEIMEKGTREILKYLIHRQRLIDNKKPAEQIYVSLPATREGERIRKRFVEEAESKFIYGDWPYIIIPSDNDAEIIKTSPREKIRSFVNQLVLHSAVYIQVIDDEKSLENGLSNVQFECSKRKLLADNKFVQILWRYNSVADNRISGIDQMHVVRGKENKAVFNTIKKAKGQRSQKDVASLLILCDYADAQDSAELDYFKSVLIELNIASILPDRDATHDDILWLAEQTIGAIVFPPQFNAEWFNQNVDYLKRNNPAYPIAIIIGQSNLVNNIAFKIGTDTAIDIDHFKEEIPLFLNKLKAAAPKYNDDGYKYDIFISYSHNSQITIKAVGFFMDQLRKLQIDGKPVSIFYDSSMIKEGEKISDAIEEAMMHSRMMLAFLTPSYFRRKNSLKEWLSFLSRWEATSKQMIFPINLFEGNHRYHPLLDKISVEDFSDVKTYMGAFEKKREYSNFLNRVDILSGKLINLLKAAPTFDPAWKAADNIEIGDYMVLNPWDVTHGEGGKAEVHIKIFLCSTYGDLHEFRSEIQKINHHLVDGFYLSFVNPPLEDDKKVTDQEEVNVFTHAIHDCDIFLLVLGNRYGSIIEDHSSNRVEQKSIIEIQYDLAKSRNKPVLVYTADTKSEQFQAYVKEGPLPNPLSKTKIKNFRARLKGEFPVRKFLNPEGLRKMVETDLKKFLKDR